MPLGWHFRSIPLKIIVICEQKEQKQSNEVIYHKFSVENIVNDVKIV